MAAVDGPPSVEYRDEPRPTSPHLPEDLERMIFEITALDAMRSIPRLMRVARRVKVWIEPILYSVVVIVLTESYHNQDYYGCPTLSQWDLPKLLAEKVFWATRDVRIYAPIDSGNVEILFSAFPGVTTLDISRQHLTPEWLPALGRLEKLCRLTSCLQLLFANCERCPFSDNIFRNLTHLCVRDCQPAFTAVFWADLDQAPSLTHIQFIDVLPSQQAAAVLRVAQLQVIIFGLLFEHWGEDLEWPKDPRLVLIKSEINSCHRGAECATWCIAELVVAAQHQGDIDPSERLISLYDEDLLIRLRVPPGIIDNCARTYCVSPDLSPVPSDGESSD
ncbi:hypothetical protein DFH06DRAFT_1174901 [Mycena polygramma]|nr:hypothetical protein DFH06DRAFT_1174901 [Mycena polygramma]